MPFRKLGGKFHFFLRFCTRKRSKTYVLLDLITAFKLLWKEIYDQLHDYLFKTGVEVYPIVCLSDTSLTVCVNWNSRRLGKMEITTLKCPVDIHYGGNLQYIIPVKSNIAGCTSPQ